MMKKVSLLSGIMALSFLLIACGEAARSEKTTCVQEISDIITFIFTANSENGEITSFDLETRRHISELNIDEDDTERIEAVVEDMGAELDGLYIVTRETFTPDELGLPTELENFIADAEAGGGTCS